MKRTLTHYFKREEAVKSKVCSPTQSLKDDQVRTPTSAQSSGDVLATNFLTNDIGTVIKCTEKLSDEQKCYLLLTNAFVPHTDFNYPYVFRKNRGNEEKRFLRKEHFDRVKCLTFSKSQNGLFCRNCVLFASNSIGKGGSMTLGSLVKSPYVLLMVIFLEMMAALIAISRRNITN